MAGPQTPTIVLPTQLAGKARAAGISQGTAKGDSLRRDDRIDPNVSIQSLRSGESAAAQMRSLSEVDGLVSAVNLNFVATALSGWRIEAYETWTNETSKAGILAAETIVSGIDTLWNYTEGFQDKPAMEQLVETALMEVILTGAVAGELVLDAARIPLQLLLFPYDSITWKSNGKGGRYPVQKDAKGNLVELNYPTVWVAESFKSADRVYTLPFTHSGVSQLIRYSSFIEDMQRVLRKSGQPRLLAKLDYAKVVSSAPSEVVSDQAKLSAYLDVVRGDMQRLLSGLEPEDALVFYDVAEMDSISSTGEKGDYTSLLQELSGLAASALKSNPSALGLRLGGSQNIASTEAMLSMKLARLVQMPVETLMSRALTLAVRLYGVDAYVKFKFNAIDLRPSLELEAHKAIAQNRVLEMLSLGRITDDEAQIMLGLGSLPSAAEELSGSRFYSTKSADTTPVSSTNALNTSVAPSGATNTGGKDNKKKV